MAINIRIAEEEIQEENKIYNVRVIVEEKGDLAEIFWNYPRNLDCNYCLLYTVSKDTIRAKSLQKIIQEERVTIYDRRNFQTCKIEIGGQGKICLLLPAVFDVQKDEYVVYEQREGNITAELKKKPKIQITNWVLEDIVEGPFFNRNVKEQKVTFRITGKEQPEPGSELLYRCIGRGRNKTIFAIDLTDFWNKLIEISILPNEEIRFEVPENAAYRL